MEVADGMSPDLHGYIIGTRLRVEKILVTLTSFSRRTLICEISVKMIDLLHLCLDSNQTSIGQSKEFTLLW